MLNPCRAIGRRAGTELAQNRRFLPKATPQFFNYSLL